MSEQDEFSKLILTEVRAFRAEVHSFQTETVGRLEKIETSFDFLEKYGKRPSVNVLSTGDEIPRHDDNLKDRSIEVVIKVFLKIDNFSSY